MSKVEKQPSKATPVRADERIEFVDILRGLAIFGILVENMEIFSVLPSALDQLPSQPGDLLIKTLRLFLVDGKFFTMLSFLFGWGMTVQMARTEARGGRFVPLFLRRLFILLIFGALHGTLIWAGDILIVYALSALPLLLFRKCSHKVLLVAAGFALLFSIVMNTPVEAIAPFQAWYADLTDSLRSGNYPEILYATGTYLEITRRRVQDFIAWRSQLIHYFGNAFGMFLLGMYVGKRKIFQEIRQHLPLLRQVMQIGLGIGVPLHIFLFSTYIWQPGRVSSEHVRAVQWGTATIAGPALMMFYVSGIILLVQKEEWHRRLAPLANVGRSSLSNYVFQSVICTLIFYNYGLGLIGRVDLPLGLILTVVIFLVQIWLSKWWFDRYQFGPLEWLWRTLTYGKRQPLRREHL